MNGNGRTKQTEYKPVIETYVRQTKEIIKLEIEGEAKAIETTPEHPFYTRVHRARDGLSSSNDEGEWREAGRLQIGDEVRLANGEWRQITSVESEARSETVYNFAVADNHNYFVGEQGTLVHNNYIADRLPILRQGTKAWDDAVNGLQQGGKPNYRVNSASDAAELLNQGRGNMNRYKQYSDKPYQKGFERHPNEAGSINAPHNNLPHIKWKDWHHPTNPGAGHIFYSVPN